ENVGRKIGREQCSIWPGGTHSSSRTSFARRCSLACKGRDEFFSRHVLHLGYRLFSSRGRGKEFDDPRAVLDLVAQMSGFIVDSMVLPDGEEDLEPPLAQTTER